MKNHRYPLSRAAAAAQRGRPTGRAKRVRCSDAARAPAGCRPRRRRRARPWCAPGSGAWSRQWTGPTGAACRPSCPTAQTGRPRRSPHPARRCARQGRTRGRINRLALHIAPKQPPQVGRWPPGEAEGAQADSMTGGRTLSTGAAVTSQSKGTGLWSASTSTRSVCAAPTWRGRRPHLHKVRVAAQRAPREAGLALRVPRQAPHDHGLVPERRTRAPALNTRTTPAPRTRSISERAAQVAAGNSCKGRKGSRHLRTART